MCALLSDRTIKPPSPSLLFGRQFLTVAPEKLVGLAQSNKTAKYNGVQPSCSPLLWNVVDDRKA